MEKIINLNFRRSCHGFTLIELMVTIAVLAILMGIAIPSFQNIIRNNRLATVSNELVSSLNLARSEAVRRGKTVKVCKADANAATPACSASADWKDGWLVEIGGTVIRVMQVNTQGVEFTPPGNSIEYTANGAVSSAGTFTIKLEGCTAGEANGKRDVSISATGRVSVASGNC